jgi:hypothetical protein
MEKEPGQAFSIRGVGSVKRKADVAEVFSEREVDAAPNDL